MRARTILAAVLTAALLVPAGADAHVLKLTFVRERSVGLVRTIVAREHATGGRVTTCYRISDHAARCGFKTWHTPSPPWTCFGHIDAFFAPVSSYHVSLLSRGAICH
jgi:hypothetical protein